MQTFNIDALSAAERSDYHLALFEAYYNLGRWDDAQNAAAKVAKQTLFPPQRKWLTEKMGQIPNRQIAGKL